MRPAKTCKGQPLTRSGVPPETPPALLIRGVAHEVLAIGASAERRDFAPPNHPDVWSFVICHLSHYFSDVVSEK